MSVGPNIGQADRDKAAQVVEKLVGMRLVQAAAIVRDGVKGRFRTWLSQ